MASVAGASAEVSGLTFSTGFCSARNSALSGAGAASTSVAGVLLSFVMPRTVLSERGAAKAPAAQAPAPAGVQSRALTVEGNVAYVEAANLDEIEVGGTLLAELAEPVCLVRLDEHDVRAIHDTCTHQQQSLSEGELQDDDTLVCAAHAAQFDLTTGESIGILSVDKVRVYACKIEDGTVLVDLDQQLNA